MSFIVLGSRFCDMMHSANFITIAIIKLIALEDLLPLWRIYTPYKTVSFCKHWGFVITVHLLFPTYPWCIVYCQNSFRTLHVINFPSNRTYLHCFSSWYIHSFSFQINISNAEPLHIDALLGRLASVLLQFNGTCNIPVISSLEEYTNSIVKTLNVQCWS